MNRWICRLTPFIALAALAVAALSACGGGDNSSQTNPDFQIDLPTTTSAAPTTTSSQSTTTSKDEEDENFSGQDAYGGGGGAAIEPVGKVPACSPATLAPAVRAWGRKQGSRATLAVPNYKCADGWAIALANIGPASQGFTSTIIFVARNGTWSPQDRSRVCPKPSPVPKRLYQLGCNSN